MRRILVLAAALALMVSVLAPGQAVLAAAPSNDDFGNATVIGALPFTDAVDKSEASTQAGEPFACSTPSQTVWYSYTPAATATVAVNMTGSSFSDTTLAVYRALGSEIGSLSLVGCSSWGSALITFEAQAGLTYYVQAASIYGGGGTLQLNAQAIPAPANDNFADARVITTLPHSSTVDTTAATVESGEPSTCATPSHTVWYELTAGATGSLSISVSEYWSSLAVFTGASLETLSLVGCRTYDGMLTFRAAEGVTYYLQLGSTYPYNYGTLHLNVQVTPAPVADFWFSPGDPSRFDSIQFYDSSYDPGQAGMSAWEWDFGDGTVSTDRNPTHRYVADGDYSVGLSVTTLDGRTGSTSRVTRVATHDVTITKLLVPTSAAAGQTRLITVGLSNNRYPETVQVQLFRSSPTGWSLVGSLMQSVPVRGINRTTPFSINYTFTKADASIGKVTFRADAVIQGYRDALPADNSVVALPTRVTR